MQLCTKDAYSRGFREYMKQKRCLIGCTPVLCPNGLDVNLLFARITLPPGRFEDFVLYLCNNHPFFNNFYYMSGSRLGVHGKSYFIALVTLSLLYSLAHPRRYKAHLYWQGRGGVRLIADGEYDRELLRH